jgi:hypothetical protein
MSLTWGKIVVHALTLTGTESGTHFGKPTVKANGWALISPRREPGSFVLRIEARGLEAFGQHRFFIGSDLRPAHMVRAISGTTSDVRVDRTLAEH